MLESVTLNFYSNHVFPRFYDLFMDRPHMAVCRERILSGIEGTILELGIGTGLNLPHYPEGVEKVTTVDPNLGMNRKALKRAGAVGMRIEQHALSGASLPFQDNSFDFVVTTWTLCSIRNVSKAIDELYRVLKPGGQYRFLEHGLSCDMRVRRWQQRLSRIQQVWAGGCRLDLDVRKLLEKYPFAELELENYYLEKDPKTHGYMYEGHATK